MSFNLLLLIVSVLLFVSILINHLGMKFGLPSLLIFILVGVLAGSDGILKIHFEDYFLAQQVGIIAITYILFMGGLSFERKSLNQIALEGILLATVGVLVTALLVGAISYYIVDLPLLECLLLGAIVSSTDAAAVFSILRSKNITLKGNLKPLLEFESGSNDPMAVFLTLGVIGLILSQLNIASLFFEFIKQFSIGIILGTLLANVTVWFINHLHFAYESLYVVITLSSVLFTYSGTELAGGNGFIAVYVLGLAMSGIKFKEKLHLVKMHDSFAWIAQIVMFMILGLLVNLKTGFSFIIKSLYISLILIFVARPIAVFLISYPIRKNLRETLLIGWVGLRGAAPIVLATFPLARGLVYSSEIFNIVFFVVLISVLLQGTTIPLVAKMLQEDAEKL